MEEQLGHYKIIDKLGKGGMGTVYKAHEMSLNRTVAIKVLAEHLAEDKTHVARFVREAQSAAALSHPNVIQIHFIGEDQGKHYFVMEYVRGESIKECLKREGKLSCERSLSLIRQAATGLAAAHDLGLVHRDIKPANIMLTPDGTVKIADFGLAFAPEDTEKLTATGMFMGTPGYVAPEQCSGEPLDKRTDIYSLGVTLYEMLAGRSAFETESKSPLALIHQVLQEDPEDIRKVNPDVDDAACGIVKKMIAKAPGDRYSDCHALLKDLDAYLSGTLETEVLEPAPTPVPSPPTIPPMPPELPSAQETPTVSDKVKQPPRVSSVAVPKQKKSSTWVVVVAIAAVVVLAAALGFLFRDQIFGPAPESQAVQGEGQAQSQSETQVSVADGDAAYQTSQNSSRQSEESTQQPEEPIQASTDEDRQLVSVESENFETFAEETASDEPEAELASATLPRAEGSESEPAANTTDDVTAAAQTPKPTEEEPKQTATAAAETESSRQATATAQTVTQPTPPPEPAQTSSAAVSQELGPTVCVIVLGDRLVARPLERHLENVFAGSQFELVDEELDPDLDDYLRANGDNARLTDLMPMLMAAKSRFLVLARIEFLEERTLQYMGRSSQAYMSRVTITPYSVVDEKPVGQKFQDRFEYTTLNADRKAQQIAIRYGNGVRRKIRQEWMRRAR